MCPMIPSAFPLVSVLYIVYDMPVVIKNGVHARGDAAHTDRKFLPDAQLTRLKETS